MRNSEINQKFLDNGEVEKQNCSLSYVYLKYLVVFFNFSCQHFTEGISILKEFRLKKQMTPASIFHHGFVVKCSTKIKACPTTQSRPSHVGLKESGITRFGVFT